MCAALVLVGGSTSDVPIDDTMIVNWYADEGIPFATANEAIDAKEVSQDLIDQIEKDFGYIPDGHTSESWSFFYDCLVDGVAAIDAALPDLEALDEAATKFEEMYDRSVIEGRIELPEPGNDYVVAYVP